MVTSLGSLFRSQRLSGKWLELLKEMVPHLARVAMLFNPVTAQYADYYLNPFKTAAASFGVEAILAPVRHRVGPQFYRCHAGSRAEQ